MKPMKNVPKKMTQAVQMRVEAFSIAHIILAKCLVPAVNTNCRPAYLEGYSGFSCSAVPVISISAWDNITKCYTKKVMMWFFFCQWHCSTQIAVDFVFFFKSILRVHFPERFSFNICKNQHGQLSLYLYSVWYAFKHTAAGCVLKYLKTNGSY